MDLKDFLNEIDADVRSLLASDFEIDIVETNFVPRFDDPSITFDDFDASRKSCKLLESCVLYVDIRGSAALNNSLRRHTLARLYSAFVRSMIQAARHFGGHIRNVVGDRVMVVFDREKCFTNAVHTAILFNTVAHYIIQKHSQTFSFRCGIGIDFGKMMIVKTGTVRKGAETEFYRHLVWLGRPANIASKLTDVANKTISRYEDGVSEAYHYPLVTNNLSWIDRTNKEFVDNLETTYSQYLKHKDPNFFSFFQKSVGPFTKSQPPILMTAAVYDGYRKESPNDQGVKGGWWHETKSPIAEFSGNVYGGSVYFIAVNNL